MQWNSYKFFTYKLKFYKLILLGHTILLKSEGCFINLKDDLFIQRIEGWFINLKDLGLHY